MTVNTLTDSPHKSVGLRFFLDSADTADWRRWIPFGMFYGITTNPLLLQRAKVPCNIEQLTSMAKQAFALGIEELQLQTWGQTPSAQVACAHKLAAIDSRIVIKVPATEAGTEVAARLIEDGLRVTLTAVYAPHQVLTAAALGADYAAPYLGRLNDMDQNGRQQLIEMHKLVSACASSTRILTASIRNIEDITALAVHGVNTFTFSATIADAWFKVQATDQAAVDFEAAAQWI